MFCPECGYENNEVNKFCMGCGKDLRQLQQDVPNETFEPIMRQLQLLQLFYLCWSILA